MAIAVMRKLRVAAVSYDRDKILNALQRTGAVEIKPLCEEENIHRPNLNAEALKKTVEEAELALEELTVASARFAKENKREVEICKDGFDVSYEEFMGMLSRKDEAEALIEKIYAYAKERARLRAELVKLNKEIASAEPYAALEIPFHSIVNTQHVAMFCGVAAGELPAFELTAVSALDGGKVVLIAAHRSVAEEVLDGLRGASFSFCPYLNDARTGKELHADLCVLKKNAEQALFENAEEEFALSNQIRFLKIYCDRIRFELEKANETSEKMLATERTVLLEGYAPEGSEEKITAALAEVTDAAYVDFTEPAEDEMPPTLMKNNEVVKNFEAVTNLYSPPNAKEFDPSTVMAFFYSLFLGFIMGDIGYGLFMVLGGGFLWWKNRVRDNGLKRLAAVFAVGGVFAVLWGFLFNSLFGVGILPVRVMPPLLEGNTNWTILGIGIPALLVIALELGVLQLFAGYVCRAIQCWRRRQIWDGILDGVVWALFSLGVGLAIMGLVEEVHASLLAIIGGIAAGVMLLAAIVTAGRKEKILGKFTKGFGAAYGVISYVSDILSYARLYGLMLSGAVIAEIVSGYALVGYHGSTGMLLSGNIGLILLGVVLLLVGHVLNLALSLLGAYIHDARLQYVEFYGRFYEGEGELFTPLGSRHKHVFIQP